MGLFKKKDEIAAEPIVFDVCEAAHEYFNDVITTEDFIIAVDALGVFFFTVCDDDQTILVKLSNYLDGLDLAREDIVACKVSWDAPKLGNDLFFNRIRDESLKDLLFINVNPDDFEATIRLMLSTREPRFSEEDVIAITECFQPSVLLQGGLQKFMKENGFDLDTMLLRKYEVLPVIEFESVVDDFGKEQAQEIYDLMITYKEKYSSDPKADHNVFRMQIQMEHDSNEAIAKATILLSAFLMIAACIMSIINVPILGVIFAIMGILQARHLALMYKTAWATALTWLNVAALIYGIITLVCINFPNILQLLKDYLFVAR